MRTRKLSIGLRTALAVFATTLVVAMPCSAAQETVLHNFSAGTTDGAYPDSGLIFDRSGNLYGTTSSGGANNQGMVFELSPSGGGWTETVLHDFNNDGKDGFMPFASLVLDAAGNLYGTTFDGGVHSGGTVFELTPQKGGGWTEKVLHNFNNDGKDGFMPYAGLVFDGKGNLYGTTVSGGFYGGGIVFQLMPKSGGGWTEKVLHNFNPNGVDGVQPWAGLIFDPAGKLYGTTLQGGAHNFGTVFQMAPRASGGWIEKVLHDFNNNSRDGNLPYAGVIRDPAGNLYGMTTDGGLFGTGTIFEMTPKTGGGWTETVLHNFNNTSGRDGFLPYASLIRDPAGNLYGTTFAGGVHAGGTAFKLAPKTGGGWTESILRDFNSSDANGFAPYAGLISDAAGNVYGTTSDGGANGFGLVFEIVP